MGTFTLDNNLDMVIFINAPISYVQNFRLDFSDE